MINLTRIYFGRPLTESEQEQIRNFRATQPNKQHVMLIKESTATDADGNTYQDGYVSAFDDATVSSNYVAMLNGFTPAPESVTVFSSI